MFPPNHWVLPIERLLERAGNGGLYQIRCLLLFSCQWLICSFFLVGYEFLFLPPIMMCYDKDADITTAIECTEKLACSASKNYFLDSNSIQSIVYEFQLVCEDHKFINICNAALFIGGALGAYYYSEIQERKGRLYTMIYTITLAAIVAMLSVFSLNIYCFAAASFLLHFALIGFMCSSVVYFSEISDDNYRNVGPCLFYAFWGMGQMLFSILISNISSNWSSIMFYYIGAPLFISAFYFRFMKESPRYCVVQHRFREAKDAIMGIAKINNRILSDFSIEEEAKLNQANNIFSTAFEEKKQPERKFNYHILTLFKYISLKKASFVILYFTSLLTTLFYNTPLSIDTIVDSPYANIFIMGFIELLAYLFAANATLNYRRKSYFRVIFILIFVSYLFFALFHIDIHATEASLMHISFFIIFVVLAKLAISAGMALFTVYICEVYPTVVRHFALGFYNTFTKLAVVLIPNFITFTNFIGVGPLLPISLLALGTLYLMSYIPETKDKNSEDYIEEEKPLLYDRVDKEMSKMFR